MKNKIIKMIDRIVNFITRKDAVKLYLSLTIALSATLIPVLANATDIGIAEESSKENISSTTVLSSNIYSASTTNAVTTKSETKTTTASVTTTVTTILETETTTESTTTVIEREPIIVTTEEFLVLNEQEDSRRVHRSSCQYYSDWMTPIEGAIIEGPARKCVTCNPEIEIEVIYEEPVEEIIYEEQVNTNSDTYINNDSNESGYTSSETYLGTFEATYYGYYTSSGNRTGMGTSGASGNELISAYSIASNYIRDTYGYGTEIRLECDSCPSINGVYRVDDCGYMPDTDGIYNNELDLWYWQYSTDYMPYDFLNAGRLYNIRVYVVN